MGFLLGSLMILAEEDRQLALVGMAHVCFLVSLVPGRAHTGFKRMLSEAGVVHDVVVRVYRASVRVLKEQGVCVSEARRLALSASNGKP